MDTYKVTDTRRMKFNGVFSLKSYYNALYDVFRSMNYDVYEDKYMHKKVGEGAEELELVWRCVKELDGYARIRIHAKTLIVGLKKVSVQIEGANVGREDGSCEFENAGYLELDYLNKWESNPILKPFKWFYNNYIYRNLFKYYSDKVTTELYAAENEIKAFFNMQKMM